MPRIPSGVLPLASGLGLAVALGLAIVLGPSASARADSMSEAEISAHFGPSAPPEVVQSLQASAAADPGPFYRALAGQFQGRTFDIAINDTPSGVDLDLHLDGSAAEAKQAAQAIAIPLQDLAQNVGGDYAVEVTVQAPGWSLPALPHFALPHFDLPHLGLAQPGLTEAASPGAPGLPFGRLPGPSDTADLVALALFGLGGVALLGFVVRRARGGQPGEKRLPAATLKGAPVLGILPGSLIQAGKLYHLQSKPCQALGYFFQQSARDGREFVVASDIAEAAGTVAICLGLYLVREGEKVLLVDLSGEEQAVSAILARFGPAPEAGEGAHGTSVPDLDLMTFAGFEGDLPDLPDDIKRDYLRILYVAPPGQRPKGLPVLEVAQMPAAGSGASGGMTGKRVGWVLVGDGVPMKLSDRYFTRYYFEKLHGESEPVPSA